LTFTVELSSAAEADLKSISDKKTRQSIESGLLRLETEPQERGKPMTGDLKGYYSIRLARQRYRALYSVEVKQNVVTILVIGIRKDGSKKDAYEIGRKRLGKK
jgi:mRNA interferase RelE/StbE